MTPTIDKEKTGQQIRLLMRERGLTVRDVESALSLACVQSVYHWLDGQSLPTVDNLYALSELLKVPMDTLIC
ncbi:MAG: helix-turn-helix transcriptional regulator, partial [Oribacterium sp.]|nr:helix-turn-helix transcriptional regulator [Oribacterium sp.]